MNGAMRSAAAIGLAAVFLTGCGGGETESTQGAVDACFADQGCDGGAPCVLDATSMNALCDCLADLWCDQDWYHAYCDGAPYPPDGGCPGCD